MYYSFWQPTYSVELYHHGIKGQKWGVRRFQNKDGPHVYDCQTGKEKKGDDLLNTLYNTDSINIGRLDNLKPDPKTIKEVTKH